jgi:hypothetical protein
MPSIQILALLIWLSAAPLAAQEAREAPVPRSWSGGNEDLETEPFPIREGAWRIDWETEDAEPSSYLVITVRHETGMAVRTFTHQGEGSGSDRIDTRPGIYYLEITGVDLGWRISITEPPRSREAGPPTVPVQACTGRGTLGGQGFVEGSVEFGNDARVYHLGGGYDSHGAVTFDLAFALGDLDEIDTNLYGFDGGVVVEMTETPLNVCPAFGFSYLRSGEFEELDDLGIDLDLERWTASAGVAFGLAVPAGEDVYVMPFAAPAVFAVHGQGSLEFPGAGGFEESETDVGIGGTGGLHFGGSRLFGGVSVTATTVEDMDPTFGLRFGVSF